MFINFIKTALRATYRSKLTSLINLFGLATGMTAAIFIFLWVQNEVTVDDYQPDNIYRLSNTSNYKGKSFSSERTTMPLYLALPKDIPEVEKAVIMSPNRFSGITFNISNRQFAEKTSAWVDRNWFNMFAYSFVQGNAASFTNNPYSIVLSESKARKYFGSADAVGQLIKMDTVNYTVAGVVKDNPLNSSFQFDILLQYDSYLTGPRLKRASTDWNNANYIAFVQLRPDASKKMVEAKVSEIIKRNNSENDAIVSLDPLKQMYFQTGIDSALPQGSKKTTYIFTVLGILLLVTACINYVNLTTARASLRAKEVSIRKITGATKAQLFWQFIAESLTISVFALLIALGLVELLLPLFNTITEKNFWLPITSITMWQILLGTLAAAIVLNGIYPALLLSSFSPLNVFRGKSLLKVKDGSIRKALVVFQFFLSVLLITSAIVIYRQLHYIQSTNPGYNVSQVVSLSIPYTTYSKLNDKQRTAYFEAFRHELEVQPGITGVSTASGEIIDIGDANGAGDAIWDGKDTTYDERISRLEADANFKNVFSVQLKSGRWFTESPNEFGNVIINETAEAQFNMIKPLVGQRFIWRGDTGQVIGVVKDFHYKSMHNKIGPMIISYNNGQSYYYFAKIAAGNIPAELTRLAGVWGKFVPNEPFAYTFLDDSFNNLYKTDIKSSTLILVFCIVAVVIAALGLFALATFTAERRSKEISIRKVLGATVQQISLLLTKEFLVLVCMAIIIATPIAWWAMNKWLQDFAYRIVLTPWLLAIGGLVALLIAILSVGTQAVKAAMANPAAVLKAE
ncbi:MAG TPA: ABC transporter permease [Chryseolinea sp.]|nr:ABC transporter permease [Chryseolinea sp.]